MLEPAAMRAVGVRDGANRWFGAIETASAQGFVWACLHDHRTLEEARTCARARLTAYEVGGDAFSTFRPARTAGSSPW